MIAGQTPRAERRHRVNQIVETATRRLSTSKDAATQRRLRNAIRLALGRLDRDELIEIVIDTHRLLDEAMVVNRMMREQVASIRSYLHELTNAHSAQARGEDEGSQ